MNNNIIINDIYIAQIRKFSKSAVKQKSLQLFSEHVQRNARRLQFSWQTVPNYRDMYNKATAAVGCPCTWHNELACCGGLQVGSSSL